MAESATGKGALSSNERWVEPMFASASAQVSHLDVGPKKATCDSACQACTPPCGHNSNTYSHTPGRSIMQSSWVSSELQWSPSFHRTALKRNLLDLPKIKSFLNFPDTNKFNGTFFYFYLWSQRIILKEFSQTKSDLIFLNIPFFDRNKTKIPLKEITLPAFLTGISMGPQ